MTDTLNRLIKKLLMSRVTLNLVYSISTSVVLNETVPSSAGRFVDTSTAYFSTASNFCPSATQDDETGSPYLPSSPKIFKNKVPKNHAKIITPNFHKNLPPKLSR
jgi:hypothetical protein